MGATAGIVGAVGSVYGGLKQKAALNSSANQLNMEAGQAVASGIQRSIAESRKTAALTSNANAAIAAGGLTTTGTSAQAVVGRIQGQGDYNERSALYEGEQQANELNYDAALRRDEGAAAETSGFMGAAGSLIKGATDFYTKYGST